MNGMVGMSNKFRVWDDFRICQEFPNYEVNRYTIVRNRVTGITLSKAKDGTVQLRKDGKWYHRSPRKLVRVAFPTIEWVRK